jgi:DNA-binding transcriptional LysR family regulator
MILTSRVLIINLYETILINGKDNCAVDINKLIPLLSEMAIFVKVVESGSLSQAAQAIGVSPSSISRSVARLELAIEEKLLERTTRKMRLTPTGEQVFIQCRDMLASAKMAVSAAQSNETDITGSLRIAAPKALSRQVLMPMVMDFLKLYPKVSFHFKVADHIIDPIGDEVDLVIRITDSPIEGLVAKKLGNCKQLLCATPAYLKEHGTPVHPNELKDHNCIVLGEVTKDRQWKFQHEKQVCEINVQGTFTVNHSEIRREAVLQGIGIALFPDFSVAKEIDSKQLVQLLPEWRTLGNYQGGIIAQYPQSKFIPSQLKAFVNYLAEALQSH